MAHITSSALRQAGRICQRASIPGAPLRGAPALSRVATLPACRRVERRGYVSESKRDNAQVAIDTAIHLDKKDFVNVVPGIGDAPGAVVSPMAGTPPPNNMSTLFQCANPATEVLKQATVMDEGQRPIYLDMQATTPVDPRVLDAMMPFYVGIYGNPHSRTHAYGWESEKAVEVVVAPFMASITLMPSATVRAPMPPAFAMSSRVEPLAEPPFSTS